MNKQKEKEVIEAAQKFADLYFTKEWMNNQTDCWIYDAQDWFFNNYLKKEESGFTILNDWFKVEIKKLWEIKWNEYFGEFDDYINLLTVRDWVNQKVEPLLIGVKENKHYNVDEAIQYAEKLVESLEAPIKTYQETHEPGISKDN